MKKKKLYRNIIVTSQIGKVTIESRYWTAIDCTGTKQYT